MLLFKTVFHVWGKQNDTMPGTPPQPDTLQDYLDEFLVLDSNKSDSIVYTTSGLKEGIYSFNAEGSIASDYEELVRPPAPLRLRLCLAAPVPGCPAARLRLAAPGCAWLRLAAPGCA
jgi:hypothetical protein